MRRFVGEESEITGVILREAFRVHNDIGPGQSEETYHVALDEALRRAGCRTQFKPMGILEHRGREADRFQPDLIVDEAVISELKALPSPFSPAHLTQNLVYLKFWRKRVGLLLNFGLERLKYRRVVWKPLPTDVEEDYDEIKPLREGELRNAMTAVRAGIRSVHQQHGLGYTTTTYQSLLRIEFDARGLLIEGKPTVTLRYADRLLPTEPLDCFVINKQIVLLVRALQESFHDSDIAVTRAYIKHLDCQTGLLVNFGTKALQIRAFSLRK
ncbi:MAG: GxxExxY protein [Abditibacteriales bacterium]|nr:GxxExxY protein [Abditibacteriales bacterium]MDW8368250.1 GxxExxY protein [Abditibacteriales bacterium]